jgi:MFS family permease
VRNRWSILAVLFAVRATMAFQFQSVAAVAPLLGHDFGVSLADIGILIGLYFAPGAVIALPGGTIGRRFGDKTTVLAGLVLMLVGGLVMTFATTWNGQIVGRLVSGTGGVLLNVQMTKMVTDWFAGREIATAMAILVMSWPFGIAMGQIGHAWLATAVGWQWAFAAASLYCLVGAGLVMAAYRPPPPAAATSTAITTGLLRREWILVVVAALVWGFFNAAYIVYLSFASRVLVAGGYGPFEAAAVISLASWVMIISATVCGQIADRTGKSDAILYTCLVVAMLSLALLPQTRFAIPLTLAFGLIGMAPAGLIMALTGQAMAPERRAFGMGIFFSIFFLFTAPTPTIAGWLYDLSGDPFWPILFAVAMFALTMVANFGFRVAQRSLR